MLLDDDVIEELKMVAGDAPELLDEIIDSYLFQLPEFLEGIEQGVKNKDAEQLMHAAHSLKGSSYNMGAKEVGEICAVLEKKGREVDFSDIPGLIQPLTTACEKTQAALLDLKSAE